MTAGYLRDKPEPEYWLGQIRQAVEFRRKRAYESSWAAWRGYYRGQWARDVLPVNIFFKMMRTMVPRVYFRNPTVTISPRRSQIGRADFALMAQVLERIDNALIDRMRLKKTMKKSIQDAFLFGTGIIKGGYGAQFDPAPSMITGTDTGQGMRNERVEYNSNIMPDTPWYLRVKTSNFLVPVNTEDWASARWAADIVKRHIDDVRADPRLKHVKNLNPGTMASYGDSNEKPLEGIVDMVEIHDKKYKKVFVMAPFASDKILYFDDDDLQNDNRLPYFPIQFNEDDQFFWAVPDAKILEPQQLELNENRTLLQKHRRQALMKWKMKQGTLDPDEATKLVNGREVGGAVILAKEADINDLQQMQASQIPNALIEMNTLVEKDVQEILGLGVNQMGEYAPTSADRSATEAQIVNQATQIRTDERRDTVADVLSEMVEHMNHVVVSRWDTQQVVDIVGPAGEQVWVAFKGTDLKNLDYDVKVDPDSAVPETRQTRIQKAQLLYQATAQNPLVDFEKVTRNFLYSLGGAEYVDFLKQGGPPQLAPGTPGSSPQNPADMAQAIATLASRRRAG